LKLLKNKVVLITGGTGSFGNAVLKKYLSLEVKEIRIFSRDEKKQDDQRKFYKDQRIKFYLGDVRDKESINDAMVGVDFVFHAAALKQVPSCEFHPLEAVRTNVMGTANVIDCAFAHKVSKIVCLSTDKAVYPINAMGTSKAMMEKVVVAKSRNAPKNTSLCLTRYGNVMSSRGSVIPLWLSQIEQNIPITVTDKEMTRFMMTLEDAVDLVEYAFLNGENGDIFVQKSPAATMGTLLESILELKKCKSHPIHDIGIRHGEKVFEVLCSKEEMYKSENLKNYFRIPSDKRDLNYEKYFEKGNKKVREIKEYSSDNTKRLDIKEMQILLKKLEEFK
jgi:UDP-glucose 4-epimerase|tara:strand:- start:635 stop:1636 length:1002 start_codon:yes stop_codon:yes gene_type:complete